MFFDFFDRLFPKLSTDPAYRIVSAMRRRNLPVDTGHGQLNVVYVEGMNPDWTPNDNAPDKWNDLRCVIGSDTGGKPRIIKQWVATTEPGFYYGRDHIINPHGAAHIQFGQYAAWQMGVHRTPDRPALIQTGGPVTVCRDRNRDFKRDGDATEIGYFGINQHDGQNGQSETIGPHSAGCLVVRLVSEHLEFIKLMKTEARYVADPHFIFKTTILPAREII